MCFPYQEELYLCISTHSYILSFHVIFRVRPQSAAEKIDMCRVCTTVMDDTPQIVLGKDKAFTYDFVFDTDSQQDQIFSDVARDLIEG